MHTIGEEDIRPRRLMEAKESCVNADRQLLLSQKDAWVFVTCPSCKGSQSLLYGEKAGFRYMECVGCRTVYTNPRPSQTLLDFFYANSENYAYWNQHIFPATEAVRRESLFEPRASQIVELCRANGVQGTLLEIGAGFGIFCEEINRKAFFHEVVGLEPTPGLAQSCRNRGIEVIEKAFEHLHGREMADVLVAFEVIEHIFDPGDFVARCFRLLRPSGLLVLTCPNVQGFDISTLRTLSNTFDHEHMNYFTVPSLASLLMKAGFEVLETRTPGKLDAELVRKQLLAGTFSLETQPFLTQILLERWDELGPPFQTFLSEHNLSSHMWLVASK